MRKVMRIGARILLAICLLCLLYRWVNPVSTIMLKRWVMGDHVSRHFTSLENISPSLVEAVIVAEDARFCTHGGVDWEALELNLFKSKHTHGASTITMQVTRNLFLWQGHSYIRKAIEIPLAIMVDLVLGKRRTMEIYLNIAEWGRGIFGAEAAARYYFHTSARRLTVRQAALLVAILPSPKHRNAADPGAYTQHYAGKISRRMEMDSAMLRCLR